mmetsp:Transcript_10557/g.21986  ORF Transcript_10557/g.21986 Transcript_10557/m.21986 type:complete len:401 (+) Transcript_10557:206-1408(+)
MARCLPMEVAATNGKLHSAGLEQDWSPGISSHRGVSAPANIGTGVVANSDRGVAAVCVTTTDATASTDAGVCPSPRGGDMDFSSGSDVDMSDTRRGRQAIVARPHGSRRTKRRCDVMCDADDATGGMERVVVARRSLEDAASRAAQCVRARAAEAASDAAETLAQLSVCAGKPAAMPTASAVQLALRPRLRPILKSYAQCAVTGRGAVPAVARRAPGGNVQSPTTHAAEMWEPKVRFAVDSKAHDGPRELNALFDKVVTTFFHERYDFATQTLVRRLSLQHKKEMVDMCRSLRSRMSASPRGRALVLPGGGGSNACLGRAHATKLRKLEAVLTELWTVARDTEASLAQLWTEEDEENAKLLDMDVSFSWFTPGFGDVFADTTAGECYSTAATLGSDVAVC